MKNLYSSFGAFRSSTKEKRLLFENQDAMSKRLDLIYGVDAKKSRGAPSSFRNDLRAKYSDLAKDSVNKPFGGRADAPPIDEDYAEALSADSIRKFLDGESLRKDPEMNRIMKKAYSLMVLYQTRMHKGKKLEGLIFGLEGGKLVVKNLDPERQKYAIAEAENQISYLKKKRTPAAEVSRNRYESEDQFRRRIKAIKDFKSTSLDQDPDYKKQQIGDWEKISTALQEFNNDYKFYREIRENLTNNPGMLRQVEKQFGKNTLLKWGKKYPDLYRKAVRESAKLDPTILEGRENDFVATGLDYKAKGMDKYFKMLTEALEDQPLALKYYPVRLKRLKSNREIGSDDLFGPDTKSTVGLPDYQDRVVENIGKAPRELLEHVLSEYNKYWKSSPDKFKDVVVAAVGAQPDLFWTDWNKSGKLNDMKNVFERIGADARGQVIGSVKTLDQLRTINAIASSPDESGIGPYLTNPAFSSKQLSSIGGNKDLMRFLKFAQPDVYTNIVDQIKDSSDNPDMAKLAAERHITGEDKSLGTLMAEIIQDYNPRVESLINWERNRGAFLAGLKYMPNAQFEMVIEKGEIPVEFLNGDSDTLIELYKKFGKKKVDEIILRKTGSPPEPDFLPLPPPFNSPPSPPEEGGGSKGGDTSYEEDPKDAAEREALAKALKQKEQIKELEAKAKEGLLAIARDNGYTVNVVPRTGGFRITYKSDQFGEYTVDLSEDYKTIKFAYKGDLKDTSIDNPHLLKYKNLKFTEIDQERFVMLFLDRKTPFLDEVVAREEVKRQRDEMLKEIQRKKEFTERIPKFKEALEPVVKELDTLFKQYNEADSILATQELLPNQYRADLTITYLTKEGKTVNIDVSFSLPDKKITSATKTDDASRLVLNAYTGKPFTAETIAEMAEKELELTKK